MGMVRAEPENETMAWSGSKEAEAQYRAAVRAAKGPTKPPRAKRKKVKDRDEVDWVMRQYGQRNRLLRELGIGPTYADYLASGLWSGIRRRVMGRDQGKCQICGEKATAVHHQRYRKDNLTGRSLAHMFAICEECHKLIEFDADGKKQSPMAASRQAFDLARRHGKGLLKERKKTKKLTKAEKKTRKEQKILERQAANLRRKNRAKVLEIQRQKKAKAPTVEIVRPKTTSTSLPPTAWTGPRHGDRN
jgi:hypothetical protein